MSNTIKANSLLIGLRGLELTRLERTHLQSPAVAGVILFTRNYQSREQLTALTTEIQAIKPMIIAVDHEGGPVQRFRSDFTELPSAESLGASYQIAPEVVEQAAYQVGQTLATELLDCGVNLSFAPVVDVQNLNSEVLKGRCFSSDPQVVAQVAQAVINGMKSVGMDAVIKHFPGHGSVQGDTHTNYVIDNRSLAEIEKHDLIPFEECIDYGVENVMAAWVKYPQVDDQPACYSTVWLQDILRQKLQFKGKVFSDDMGMEASKFDGSPQEAIAKALAAGCNYVLLCNDFAVIDGVLGVS